MAVRVTELPATKHRFTATPINSVKRRRTAAYARVSTDHADQITSYAAQVDYYKSYIQSRSDLDFVNIYADEGITGTSTVHRKGFKQMISDALDGKIDLIITKSVSRFARNTVDSLSAIRLLKEHGVECYFEKENIHTFDSKGELLLTIMSSIAQEEARSISENCTWGQRKRFAEGKVTVPFSRFLGYDRGEDGSLIINKEEAEIVRRIYELFLSGETPYGIAKLLTADGIPTPGGKEKWSKEAVRSILTNEKYKGDALLQKVFTVDFLTKKKKINEGEVPQYYVEGNHEGIVSDELFEAVQAEFDRRSEASGKNNGSEILPKIVCGECGGFFTRKVWHSTNKFRRVIWRCCRKSEGCRCTHLLEEEIRLIIAKAADKRQSESGESVAIERIVVFDKSDILVIFGDGEEIRADLTGNDYGNGSTTQHERD
ncbi:MAG: recombinase family protein [Oscillospiraceae bacterium]